MSVRSFDRFSPLAFSDVEPLTGFHPVHLRLQNQKSVHLGLHLQSMATENGLKEPKMLSWSWIYHHLLLQWRTY